VNWCNTVFTVFANWHSSATLTEVFPCFSLSCKANAKVKHANTGHGPHSSKIFVLFYALSLLCRSVYCVCVCVCMFVCKCVLYYCHRVATQLQLTYIYHNHCPQKYSRQPRILFKYNRLYSLSSTMWLPYFWFPLLEFCAIPRVRL